MRLWKQHKLLEPGARISDFRLPLLDGDEVALGDILSKGPALLAFFKISCPVCQLTFPHLERMNSSPKLSVYGISQNNAPDTRDFNRRFGITFPVLLDSRESDFPVSNAFGISHVPTLFLVGSGGVIESVSEGWAKADIRKFGEIAGVDPFEPNVFVPETKAG